MAQTHAVRLRRAVHPLVRGVVVAAAGLLLSGCVSLGGQPEPVSLTRYVFAPELPPGRQTPAIETPLYVSTPSAAAAYASPRMAYSKRRFEIEYFARSRWAGEPARMLQPWLVAALGVKGAFANVSTGAGGPPAQLRLITEILTLRQDFSTTPSQAEVALRAQLVDVLDNRILATRTLEAREPAPSEDAYGGVEATNRALTRILSELVTLCTASAQKLRR